LAKQVRREEPQRRLDSFLVAGLIEARSHERMALLAGHSPDQELRGLYGQMVASEARHFGLYWMLAEKGFGRQATIERLQELAAAEVAALQGVLAGPQEVRFHSFGVQNG
jgi:tRNA-(ms[2]io[6]A)-hydroxylase